MGAKESTLRETNSLTFSHWLTIENFAHLYDEACQWKWSVESEVFSAPENEQLKFSLSIWPKVKGSDGEEYFLVALLAYAVPAMWKGKVKVKEVRSIEDGEGRKLDTKVYPDEKEYKESWINFEFMPLETLLHPTTGYLRKGALTVVTQVTLLSQENLFNLPSNPDTFSITSIPSSVARLSHRLTLSHFKWLTEKSTGEMPLRVESQYFAPERKDIGKMRLVFYPKGKQGDDAEKVVFAIQNENPSSLLVHYECSLVDSKGDQCHQMENTHHYASLSAIMWSLSRRALLSLLSSLPSDELIIDCQFTILAPEKAEITSTPSCTFTDLALFNYHYVPFTWTIEDYRKQASTQECIISQFFSPPTDSRFTFFLCVYPKADKEYVQIELNLASNCPIDECKVNWRGAVVDAKGEEWRSWEWDDVIEKDEDWGLRDLISHQTLDNYRGILLPGDKLTIKSEVWIHEPCKKLPPELSKLPACTFITICD